MTNYMTISGMRVKEEVKVKCEDCGVVFFATSQYAECECGGEAFNISLSETVYEAGYESSLGL